MRVGIFGGSFDPVHLGHLLLAEHCREACQLDRVVFMPAALSPHKQDKQPASNDARVEMLQLAIGGHEPFEVSRFEIDRGGVSYTVDTLRDWKQQHPGQELFFLIGGDALADFPTWREPQEIFRLATLVFVSRPHEDRPDFSLLDDVLDEEQIAALQAHHVDMPQIDISSTDIRRRVAEEKSIRFQTPRSVEKYIETTNLYR